MVEYSAVMSNEKNHARAVPLGHAALPGKPPPEEYDLHQLVFDV
jgi:hypothetical protein